jgi:hypothetical protein
MISSGEIRLLHGLLVNYTIQNYANETNNIRGIHSDDHEREN